ncbi:MAG: hypothetical protein ACREME_02700, partial [Gemmatimonadales bacterium]
MPHERLIASASSRRHAARLTHGALAVLTATAGACAGGPASDGVDADALAPLALIEEFRIGSLEDPDSGFTAIHGVDVDRDG